MAQITLKSTATLSDIVCIPPRTTFPVSAAQGCFINIVGHVPTPPETQADDGIYIYDGFNWSIWESTETI